MLNKIVTKSIRPLYKMRVLTLILCVIDAIVALIPAILIGLIIDKLDDRNYVIMLGLIASLIVILHFFTNWIQNYYWFKMIHKGTALVREVIFEKLLCKSHDFFEENSSGDLLSKVVNDSALYAQNKLITFPMLFTNCTTLFVVLSVCISASMPLSAMAVLLLSGYFLSYLSLNKRLRSSTKKERESFSSVLDTGVNILDGMYTIRLFRSEDFFASKFGTAVRRNCDFIIKLQFWKSMGISGADAILGIASALCLIIGAILIQAGHLSIGSLVMFNMLLNYTGEPVRNLTDYNLGRQGAKAVASRLENLLASNAHDEEPRPLVDEISSIILENVSFKYNGMERQVIKELTLSLESGDRLAIVGASGTGKSTLIKLLLGLLSPTRGQILINGKTIGSYDYKSYLSHVSILPQDIFLFDGSISENVKFGTEFEQSEIFSVLETVSLNKLNQNQGVKGFSGGERQRVGLARALLRTPDILILDEPTSALDAETERIIVDNIEKYLNGKKTILVVISHRHAILTLANRKIELLSLESFTEETSDVVYSAET